MTTGLAARVAAQPFFASLEQADLMTLCETGRQMAYPPDTRLFADGGPADRFWLLEHGSVALDLHAPGRGDQVIETLTAGTVLGWSWLHPPYRWHFGAVIRSPVTAVEFDAAAVRQRCEADHAFGYAILRLFTPVITERLYATRLRLMDLYGPATIREEGR